MASSSLIKLIQRNATPVQFNNPKRHDNIIQAVGNAKIVMIGEASHGTHEFYLERAELTKRLIQEKGFTFVAVEADWPDAYRINRYVRGIEGGSPDDALADFKRFPRWMWRNEVMLDFVQWLRNHNESLGDKKQHMCGFYGLDLYSLFESASAVIEFLTKNGYAEEAKRAKERYGCFDRYHMDSQAYGHATSFGFAKSCQKGVTEQLTAMLNQYAEASKSSGFHGDDEIFFARQNAKVVKNAEEYYRSMFTGNTWNMRDGHMVETLRDIMEHLETSNGLPQKAVVWAHNSHLGDAGATDSAARGETNVGELVRKNWNLEQTFNIGFTTHTGTVSAADNWDENVRFKKVRPGMANSYELLFHQVEIPNFNLVFRSNDRKVPTDEELNRELAKKRLERAIGVIYRPDTERSSHYFYAKLPNQFDSIIHIDTTKAVKPLDKISALNIEEHEEETYPFGL